MSAEKDTLQKAESLWFSPDVVILQADTRIFRVFAAILTAQSSVFADMFTFPQPPSTDMETMDGYPVVKLHDDAEEVDVFLKAIFDSSFFMPPPEETNFETILAILRLSHKYDVPYLRRRALQHLETTYPTCLSVDESREGNDTISEETSTQRFMTIQVATEVGALWLLPVAYHDLCKQTISTIISELWWNSIGEKERTACLVGHSKQLQYFPRIFKFLFVVKEPNTECHDWPECNRIRLQYVHDMDIWQNMHWTLDAWPRTGEDIGNLGMCEDCTTEAEAMYATARQAFWDQLPTMFGLPGWEELEEMRRVAPVVP
ncbi:hypothetical protein C8R43DRAFT_1108075 [Mycena crocata]|nr:hypothetical protein C8R43DRAFT_1108075 [Mycena crocata]